MVTRAIHSPALPPTLNDIHSGLNPTNPATIHRPRCLDALCGVVRAARRRGEPISIAGGRHAMGGQQFAAGATHIDTTGLDRPIALDTCRGILEAEAGMMWPAVIGACHALQPGEPRPWTIAQKQTGGDDMTLGGSLAANIHGRGLVMTPIVGDVESIVLVDATGTPREVSRTRDPSLFALTIGGYGLFGVIYSVRLRLVRRAVLRRRVALAEVVDLPRLFNERIVAGAVYGDFQFSIDHTRPDFLRRGILSCYEPVDRDTPVPHNQHALTPADWLELLRLAHTDKHRGFERYVAHYVGTDGQLYHSDTAQLSTYIEGYHQRLGLCGSEMIGEQYIPLEALPAYMQAAATALRVCGADVIYGTVRLIRRDTETFLRWARRDYACVVFNLHTPPTDAGLARTGAAFRALIDAAIRLGGSYYLTYHRFASREQVLACYPQMPEFLGQKESFDPDGVYDSEWRRHMARLVG